MYHVLTDVFHLDAEYFWHEKELPESVDAVILPGGFSYGDRLRAGVIAAHSPIIKDVKKMAEKGTPILGVCNGFQILVESGLLPGVLLKNESLNFMCEWTNLIVENNKTPFTNQFQLNEKIPIPIANGEGRYYVDDDTMEELKKKNQIVFRYSEVVNGSANRIAGVIDNKPSSLIFESLLTKMGVSK
jgi:phosphoribosylformylglycinamidine synthase